MYEGNPTPGCTKPSPYNAFDWTDDGCSSSGAASSVRHCIGSDLSWTIYSGFYGHMSNISALECLTITARRTLLPLSEPSMAPGLSVDRWAIVPATRTSDWLY